MSIQAPDDSRAASPEDADREKRRRRLIGALLVAAVLGGVLIWVLLRSGDEKPPPARRATAAGLSLQRLKSTAGAISHPVYWVGPQRGDTYEFSETNDGRIYIRYLPPGTKVGTSRGDYLSVGTYPQRNALATLKATARAQRARTLALGEGGLALQDINRPTSVYAAFPGLDYQVEVFEPSGGRALELVRSGQLEPLVRPTSRAASVADLRRLSGTLGHRVYWAGPGRGTTYEVTRTRDDRVYIRYLPRRTKIGDPRPRYDTVGTYPQKDAVANLRKTAAKLQATTIRLPGGGLAYVDRQHPTSAYLAYPSADLEVEIYTPDPKRTERLLTSREIKPVG
jgi:hypothetical protein